MEKIVSRERILSWPRFGRSLQSADAPAQQLAQNYGAALVLCVAALTVFRLVAVAFSNMELFFDEAQYWFWSRELALGYYSKPPLIAWIIRGATEICGQGEACIRAPSALIHGATAILIYAIACRLYDARIGFWAGLTYATLPGVSLSSSLISTDVPLLFFVALALYSLIRMRETGSWLWAAALGTAIGFGLLSKYAMSYFLLCLALYTVWAREGRALLKDAKLYAAIAIGAALIAPNILWNAQNGFATFSHTASNARWSGTLLHPDKALEFLGSQLGVFGPILFVAFVAICVNWLRDRPRRGSADAERLLLAFSAPILILMTLQAFLSRAFANWAAFAYIAATVLVTAVLLREGWIRVFRASLLLHCAVSVLIAVGGVLAGRIDLPGDVDPYSRVLGWKALAEAAGRKAKDGGFKAIATDRRALAAELFYYLRDANIPVVAIRDGPPDDHFELTRPLTDDTPRPILLVSFKSDGPSGSRALGAETIGAGPAKSRQVFFHAIENAAR